MRRGICPACRLEVAVTTAGRVDGRHYCLRASNARQLEALPLPPPVEVPPIVHDVEAGPGQVGLFGGPR
jgi:hypothetical protein